MSFGAFASIAGGLLANSAARRQQKAQQADVKSRHLVSSTGIQNRSRKPAAASFHRMSAWTNYTFDVRATRRIGRMTTVDSSLDAQHVSIWRMQTCTMTKETKDNHHDY